MINDYPLYSEDLDKNVLEHDVVRNMHTLKGHAISAKSILVGNTTVTLYDYIAARLQTLNDAKALAQAKIDAQKAQYAKFIALGQLSFTLIGGDSDTYPLGGTYIDKGYTVDLGGIDFTGCVTTDLATADFTTNPTVITYTVNIGDRKYVRTRTVSGVL